MADDLYRTLGVARNASEAEIRRAYRTLAKEHHPDRHPGDKSAEERFKRISAAYEVLKNKDRRARYDRGDIDAQGNERPGAGGFWHQQARGGDSRFEFRGNPGGFAGFDDIISELFGARGGGGHGGAQQPRMRGEDVQIALSVDFAEAARGARKPVKLPDGRTVEINVPAAVEEGQTLRLRGQGPAGSTAGLAGDILIEIKVKPHPSFIRDGFDVRVDQPVPLATAVLGGSVRVPTIDGEVSLTVPAWTSSGKLMRLRGRGIEDKKSGKKGDQLVRLMIKLPENGDARLEELMQRIGSESSVS